MFAITTIEMGLSPILMVLISLSTIFSFCAFIVTSKNIDLDGLLRVLYAKPLRKTDGTVEYRKD